MQDADGLPTITDVILSRSKGGEKDEGASADGKASQPKSGKKNSVMVGASRMEFAERLPI